MTLEVWGEVKFKILEDCGRCFALDTDFHLAKVRLPDGETRFASFEEGQFRRLKSRNEWIKAAVCYPVFDVAEGMFFLHPIGERCENAVASLSICPDYMHGSDSQHEWSDYRRILSQGHTWKRNLLSGIIGALRPNIM
jgi:hypothetical protein